MGIHAFGIGMDLFNFVFNEMRLTPKTLSILSIALGMMGILTAFSFFLVVASVFLSGAGLYIAIRLRKKEKNTLNKSAWIINIISLVIFGGQLIYINYTDYKSSQTIFEYYLPKGFTGWTNIKCGVKSAPAIPVKANGIGGRHIIIFPASGRLETSSLLEEWHRSKYFWYDEKDTISFESQTGEWGKDNYKSWIHC